MLVAIPSSLNQTTLDVQTINVTVVGESTTNVQCLFIYGSDSVRCRIIFVSEYLGIADNNANITGTDTLNVGRDSFTILTTFFVILKCSHNHGIMLSRSFC